MKDFVSTFISLFTDKSIKSKHRFFVILVIIVAIVSIDNIIGFTFYLNSKEKINIIQSIYDVKLNNNISSDTSEQLNLLETTINNRENIIEKLIKFIKSINIKDYIPAKAPQQSVPRNNLLLFILSAWPSIMAFLVLPVSLLMAHTEDGNPPKGRDYLINLIGMWIILTTIAFSSYYLAKSIPMINSSWSINYVISFLIQPIFIVIIILLFAEKD